MQSMTIFWSVVNSVLFVFILYCTYGLWTGMRNRKDSCFILAFRIGLKILWVGLAVFVLMVPWHFPEVNTFFCIELSIVLVILSFSSDIIVVKKGIFFFSKLLAWDEIIEIYDKDEFVWIRTKTKWRRKGFLKLMWKIKDRDIELLKQMHKEKTVLSV